MIETDMIRFAVILTRLQELRGVYELDALDDWLGPDAVEELSSQINQLSEVCKEAKFRNALTTVITTQQWLQEEGPSSHHKRACPERNKSRLKCHILGI